jgi:hypothetical protein
MCCPRMHGPPRDLRKLQVVEDQNAEIRHLGEAAVIGQERLAALIDRDSDLRASGSRIR